MANGKIEHIAAGSLFITFSEGAGVVVMGGDGKVWVATFAAAEMAHDFLEGQQAFGPDTRVAGTRAEG